jgi:transcriptional regulator with XRE-family HTH domain
MPSERRDLPSTQRHFVLFAAPCLRAYRIGRHLTQAGLASRAGIARLSIVRLERPGGTGRIDTIRKLAAALGVRDDDLIGGPVLPLRLSARR